MTGRTLIVVHPGSAMGSNAFHWGDAQAQEYRDVLEDAVASFRGPVWIIDGTLSSELAGSSLGATLDAAVARPHSGRVNGCDGVDGQFGEALRFLIETLGPVPCDVVGCWFDGSGRGHGCVNYAATALALGGLQVRTLSESCVPLPPDETHTEEATCA